MQLATPTEFSLQQSLWFLRRSPRELLHRCTDDGVIKLIRAGHDVILFEVRQGRGHTLQVKILNTPATKDAATVAGRYIREWFDLDTDLKPFYALAAKDPLLKDLVEQHYGYRIVGQPDLFESLVWAVLGQQINVSFAFTLKERFVRQFGEKMVLGDDTYYLFPRPEVVAVLTEEDLLPLQFSRQKTKYILTLAEAFARGTLSRDALAHYPLAVAKEELIKVKGIGNWTANYALMKTFRYPDAFPLEDAGIHNAIKNLKGMKAKPTLEQVKRIFKKYKGWEAYATLYLWRSL